MTKKLRKKRTVFRKYEPVTGVVFPEFDILDIEELKKMTQPFYYGENWPDLFKNRCSDRGENKFIPNYEQCRPTFRDVHLRIGIGPGINRRTPTVEVVYPINQQGLYCPGGKGTKHLDLYRAWDTRRADPNLNEILRKFWFAVREEWTWQRRAKIEQFQKKLTEDSSFAEECQIYKGAIKTKATIDALTHLSKIRSAVEGMIAGVSKGTVSKETYKTFVKTLDKYGKCKKPITEPVRNHFLNS